MADDLVQHLADVLGADEDRRGGGESLFAPGRELLVAAHRVLQLGAVCLDRVARAGRRSHRPAEEDVVREDDVRREVFAERGGVQVDVAVTLLPREVGQAFCFESLVAVKDEDRQEAADVGADVACAAEVVLLRARLLREDGHVVAAEAPFPGERARVDVRAGPAEQVAVPEEDLQRGSDIRADANAADGSGPGP